MENPAVRSRNQSQVKMINQGVGEEAKMENQGVKIKVKKVKTKTEGVVETRMIRLLKAKVEKALKNQKNHLEVKVEIEMTQEPNLDLKNETEEILVLQ